MPEPLELIRIAGSETRRQILRLLQQGFDHPEDLAKKLKIRRTSVDKQLVELFAWGLVDRAAIFPPNGRPRIVFQVTQRGKDLLDLLERVVKEYTSSFKSDFARELEALEAKLAAGEIAEEMYFKRRKELEGRYSLALLPPFLAPRAVDRFLQREVAARHRPGERRPDLVDAPAVEARPTLDLAHLSGRGSHLGGRA